MEHTEYYHLPQWEADDRIMRTDFNEAMASIDTALDKKCTFTQLVTVSAAAGSTQLSVDLTDIDWSQWQYVHFDFDFVCADSANVIVNVNGQTAGCYYHPLGGSSISGGIAYASLGLPQTNRLRVTLLPWLSSDQPIKALSFERSSMTFGRYSDLKLSAAQTLNFVSSRAFSDTAHLTVWGER